MMTTIRWFFLTLLFSVSALAQSGVTSLLPPTDAVATDSTVPIDLVVFNPSTSELSFASQRVLGGTLFAGDRSWPIQLESSVVAPASIAPNSFSVQKYELHLPAGAAGRVIIEVTENLPTPARAVINVRNSEAATEPAKATPPLSSLVAPTPAASNITRTFAGRLAPHEPIYFIYGADKPAIKFQFSLKYRLLSLGRRSEDSIPPSLEFGFTQRSLWDVNGNSSPFYDTSYMPEIFIESLGTRPRRSDGWFTWLGFQTGFKHESNGRDGTDSRSLNTGFIRPAFAFGSLQRWSLLVLPEFYTYVGGLTDNPDLKDYRGYGRLRLVLGRHDGLALMTTLMAGKKFDHETVQLDLTIPIRAKYIDLKTYLLIQYFNGYGESLLSYNQTSETVRAGISLVR